MSGKEFCESGKHLYKETDVVRSILDGQEYALKVWILVSCSKCDSMFLREVDKPLP